MCDNIAPLDFPVVPVVKRVSATSSGNTYESTSRFMASNSSSVAVCPTGTATALM